MCSRLAGYVEGILTDVHLSRERNWPCPEKYTIPTHCSIACNTASHRSLKALENLQIALETVDGTLDDVLLLHIYILESVIDESTEVRDGLRKFFPKAPPATSWIGVPHLANADFLIEIEALAVLP